ncbi:hypothetical protein ACFX12_041488 [Malus domestica]
MPHKQRRKWHPRSLNMILGSLKISATDRVKSKKVSEIKQATGSSEVTSSDNNTAKHSLKGSTHLAFRVERRSGKFFVEASVLDRSTRIVWLVKCRFRVEGLRELKRVWIMVIEKPWCVECWPVLA